MKNGLRQVNELDSITMAKRFIDTGLFDDEWFSELDNECKIFWIYYLTKCDHAGLLKYNKKLIEFQTGVNSLERVIKELGNRLVRVTEVLLYCPKFIEYQYPGFPKSGVKQQESAIKLLIAAGLWNPLKSGFELLPNSPLTVSEVLPKTYVRDNVIGSVNDNDNVNGREAIENQIFGDELFIENLKRIHKGKDIRRAWDQCYLHHSQQNPGMEGWQWRQKLGSWLTIYKEESKINTFQQ